MGVENQAVRLQGERGNKPYDLERMLRIYMLQNLYDLSDMGTVAEVIDSRAFSAFCGVDSSNQVPDGRWDASAIFLRRTGFSRNCSPRWSGGSWKK